MSLVEGDTRINTHVTYRGFIFIGRGGRGGGRGATIIEEKRVLAPHHAPIKYPERRCTHNDVHYIPNIRGRKLP